MHGVCGASDRAHRTGLSLTLATCTPHCDRNEDERHGDKSITDGRRMIRAGRWQRAKWRSLEPLMRTCCFLLQTMHPPHRSMVRTILRRGRMVGGPLLLSSIAVFVCLLIASLSLGPIDYSLQLADGIVFTVKVHGARTTLVAQEQCSRVFWNTSVFHHECA